MIARTTTMATMEIKSRRVKIKVMPRSSRNEIVGEMPDGTLKVKLMAAPVDGKANECLLDFLSESWKIAKSRLRLVRGHHSRTKIIEISASSEE